MTDRDVAQGNGHIGVLIVDDHRMFAESLGRLLTEEQDIALLGIATTGAQAMELAASVKPRVVLMDYQLPDGDGVAVAGAIKQRDPEIMVVVLTGMADDAVLLAAIEAGCSGFLTKDRAATDVVDAVRAAAAGEALIAPAMLALLLPKLHRNYRPARSDLTDREVEILGLLAAGRSTRDIAQQLHLSVNTVRNYVQAILTKLDAHSKLEAVATAVRQGIVRFPPEPSTPPR